MNSGLSHFDEGHFEEGSYSLTLDEATFDSLDILDLLPQSLPGSPFDNIPTSSEDCLSEILAGNHGNISDILHANNDLDVPTELLPESTSMHDGDTGGDSSNILTTLGVTSFSGEEKQSKLTFLTLGNPVQSVESGSQDFVGETVIDDSTDILLRNVNTSCGNSQTENEITFETLGNAIKCVESGSQDFPTQTAISENPWALAAYDSNTPSHTPCDTSSMTSYATSSDTPCMDQGLAALTDSDPSQSWTSTCTEHLPDQFVSTLMTSSNATENTDNVAKIIDIDSSRSVESQSYSVRESTILDISENLTSEQNETVTTDMPTNPIQDTPLTINTSSEIFESSAISKTIVTPGTQAIPSEFPFVSIPTSATAISTTGGFPATTPIGYTDLSIDVKTYQKTPLLYRSAAARTVSELLGTTRQRRKGKHEKNLPCAVCGDDAQCLHYGVAACEGCKGFFKRTVQKNSRYMCLGKERCKVDKRRRNHCQYCRYQKCLEVGMMKEVVRKNDLKGRRGRLPSAVARQARSRAKSPPSPVSFVTSLVRAFIDTVPSKSTLDYSQFQLPPSTLSEEFEQIPIGHMKPNDPHEKLQQFYTNLCASFHHIKNWAGKIPGWFDLPEHDRYLLFQTASLEVLVLRLAYRYHPSEQHVIFCNGKVYHRCQAVIGFGEWLDYIIAFCEVVHQMDIDITSFSCLTSLTLITERLGLLEPKKVEKLQDEIITALQEHIANSAAVECRHNYLSKLLSILPELRTLSKQGLHRLYFLRLEGGVPSPPMMDKMFQPHLPY